MDPAVWVVAIYGVVSLVGGIIGYVKANSRASLVAGSVSGIVLLVCAYGIKHGNHAAMVVGVVFAALLGGRFLGTWRRTRRVMPDLVMVLLGIATLAAVGVGWLRR